MKKTVLTLLHTALLGGIAAVQSNTEMVPAKYRLAVIVGAASISAALPSPLPKKQAAE